jgi:hypothetical protein
VTAAMAVMTNHGGKAAAVMEPRGGDVIVHYIG